MASCFCAENHWKRGFHWMAWLCWHFRRSCLMDMLHTNKTTDFKLCNCWTKSLSEGFWRCLWPLQCGKAVPSLSFSQAWTSPWLEHMWASCLSLRAGASFASPFYKAGLAICLRDILASANKHHFQESLCVHSLSRLQKNRMLLNEMLNLDKLFIHQKFLVK